ncbi:hypothetical protein E2C01_013909 [Portunus trituberculatus]|uniref:Uncharacterized protein n=1 Tax=Portunus trituberculatus TaxID=210409 RepID=A0A5B7DIJ1_PORTR|nr:hypothetical protein [Portunus trituberculatus]
MSANREQYCWLARRLIKEVQFIYEYRAARRPLCYVGEDEDEASEQINEHSPQAVFARGHRLEEEHKQHVHSDHQEEPAVEGASE